jgi:hypothetical protein
MKIKISQLILATIVLIAGIFALYFGVYNGSETIYYGEYRDCVENKAKFFSSSDYSIDSINVIFNNNVSLKDAINLLNASKIIVLGVNNDPRSSPTLAIYAKTPQEKKFYLMCKLEKEPIVNRTYVSIIGKADV